jgi:hypothetical protein
MNTETKTVELEIVTDDKLEANEAIENAKEDGF